MEGDRGEQSAQNKGSSLSLRVLQFFIVLVASGIAAGLTYYYRTPINAIVSVKVIYLVILLVGGYLGITILGSIIMRATQRGLGATRSRGAKNFFLIVAFILLLIAAFSLFGFDLASFLVAGGFIGIVLGLAAQQVLGNIFGGISLLFSRPFEIGDRITMVSSQYGLIGPSYPHETMLPGYTGIVADVGIIYTTILLDEGVPTMVPNAQMVSALILNHSKVTLRAVRIRFDIDRSISFEEFRTRLFELLQTRESSMINTKKLGAEIIDATGSTYQVIISVWVRSELEEPSKSIVLRDALSVVNELSSSKEKEPQQ